VQLVLQQLGTAAREGNGVHGEDPGKKGSAGSGKVKPPQEARWGWLRRRSADEV
jgi:hypothetical protein